MDSPKLKDLNSWKKRLVTQSELLELGEKLRETGKRIVFTAGAWDMLHVGQVRYLQQARQLGDILVVGVSSNEAIRKVKGKNRPILDEKIRAEMLCYVRPVDIVTILPEPSCQPALGLLKPDIYVTVDEDWNEDFKNSREYKTVTKYGGEVKRFERQSPFISTTKILERAVSAQLGDSFKEFMNLRKNPLKE